MMVTPTFAKGAGVTVMALGGMLLGFYVQDEVRRRKEVRAHGGMFECVARPRRVG
jgi:hypothetical protein